MAIKFQDLPRVEIEIIDKSEFYGGVAGLRPALIIGAADKGPVGVPVEIRSSGELIFTFGKPLTAGLLAAYLYLNLTGNPVIYTRSFHTDFINAREISKTS